MTWAYKYLALLSQNCTSYNTSNNLSLKIDLLRKDVDLSTLKNPCRVVLMQKNNLVFAEIFKNKLIRDIKYSGMVYF